MTNILIGFPKIASLVDQLLNSSQGLGLFTFYVDEYAIVRNIGTKIGEIVRVIFDFDF